MVIPQRHLLELEGTYHLFLVPRGHYLVPNRQLEMRLPGSILIFISVVLRVSNKFIRLEISKMLILVSILFSQISRMLAM